MKYRVKLLTQRSGIIEIDVNESDNMDVISASVQAEHGTFITLSVQYL